MTLQEIPNKVHFVGIGGVGMSGLAQHLLNCGYAVSGSDRIANDRTDALAKMGVDIRIGHRAENVGDCELVVRTSAVHDDNVEKQEAKRRNIPTILREQLLGAIFNSFENRVAVCGTHGKTTVTAMIHEILSYAGVSHTSFIGGVYDGNNYFFGENLVVAEACEFNRSFLNLNPTVCVCLNSEHDHPDCYADEQAVHTAFSQFMQQVDEDGAIVLPSKLGKLCSDRRCVYFDELNSSNPITADGKQFFDVELNGKTYHAELGVVGIHNVYNAKAAIACALILGVLPELAVDALKNFHGVDRRWTEKRIDGLCNVVCDYAHHPTEIACAVDTARSVAKGRVVCVFQPHTYSRTRAFFKEFATCFTQADVVAYLPIYSARETPLNGVTSQHLTLLAQNMGINALYLPDFDAAMRWIRQTVNSDDLLLILGAGDVVQLADML